MKMIIRKIAAVTAVALTCGLTTLAAPAFASEPNISDITYGESTFEAADNVETTTNLKSKTKGKFYLNVQAKPMTPAQIQPGSCVTKAVGTPFFNEVIDPVTGEHKFDPTTVKPGDQVFCNDRSGVLRKKSCGNKALFGSPPPPKTHVKGKIKTVDYLKWVAAQTQKITKSGSAFASVKTATCEARGTVDNTVVVFHRYRMVIKSRTMSEAQAEGARQITIIAENDQKVQGTLKTDIEIGIKGKATALCTTPPPEHDECLDVPGNQPPGYVCTTPPPPPVVTGDIVCANPPHLYHPNGNGLVFCELVRSDGVKPQLANFSIEGLNDFAHFAQPTETSWRDDSTLNPCPANTLCVRIQVWADAVGLFKYLAKFSDLDQVPGSIDIKADEFIVETS